MSTAQWVYRGGYDRPRPSNELSVFYIYRMSWEMSTEAIQPLALVSIPNPEFAADLLFVQHTSNPSQTILYGQW